MISELLGTPAQTQQAMTYLESHQLQVEVLGHVQRND
jgi:D-methionine transport system ATP-binding protein